ncbi:MAG: hypothetical protein Q7R70_05435, partial [Candidatus Diapherotrites archaeon]|nr:hypothetical protein [Candidatus Diapherotrites archaeon]
ETEKTIFETIELNRQCRPDAIQVSIFSPYEGTELHEMCAKNGWIREETSGDYYTHTSLSLPTISPQSIDAFHKTFILYCYSPKIFYPFIHLLRILLEKMPRKARDFLGKPILLGGRIIGVWKIHGFLETCKNCLIFIKNK